MTLKLLQRDELHGVSDALTRFSLFQSHVLKEKRLIHGGFKDVIPPRLASQTGGSLSEQPVLALIMSNTAACSVVCAPKFDSEVPPRSLSGHDVTSESVSHSKNIPPEIVLFLPDNVLLSSRELLKTPRPRLMLKSVLAKTRVKKHTPETSVSTSETHTHTQFPNRGAQLHLLWSGRLPGKPFRPNGL